MDVDTWFRDKRKLSKALESVWIGYENPQSVLNNFGENSGKLLTDHNVDKQIWDIKFTPENQNSERIMGISCVWDGMYYAKLPRNVSNYSNFADMFSDIQSYNFPKVETLYYAFDFVPIPSNVPPSENDTDKSEVQQVVQVSFYENNIEVVDLV